MGQHFPHGNNCQVLIPDDTIHSLTIGFKTMYKDEKIETWEYTILGWPFLRFYLVFWPFHSFNARKKPNAIALGFFQRNPPYRVGEIASNGGEIVLRTVKFALRRVGGFHFTTNEVSDFTWAKRRFHILRSKIFHFSFRCYTVLLFPYSTASKKYQHFKAIVSLMQSPLFVSYLKTIQFQKVLILCLCAPNFVRGSLLTILPLRE